MKSEGLRGGLPNKQVLQGNTSIRLSQESSVIQGLKHVKGLRKSWEDTLKNYGVNDMLHNIPYAPQIPLKHIPKKLYQNKEFLYPKYIIKKKLIFNLKELKMFESMEKTKTKLS